MYDGHLIAVGSIHKDRFYFGVGKQRRGDDNTGKKAKNGYGESLS